MARDGRKATHSDERTQHEAQRDQLNSGSTGEPVRTRRQAIAIGLAESRWAGAKARHKDAAPRERSSKASR